MTREYASRELTDATARRDSARAAFTAAKPGTRRWREAEEDLNFWQGKVANLTAALQNIDAGRM